MRGNNFLENDELLLDNIDYSPLSEMGAYLRDICNERVLTVEEERELVEKIKKGDKEAREQLIQSNLKLVVYMAKSFKECGIPLIDLVQEGNVALLRAVDGFDPNLGYKFSTYASNCVRYAIIAYITNMAKFVRLPQNIQQQLCAYNNELDNIKDCREKPLTTLEITEKLNIPYQTVVQYNELMKTPISLNKLASKNSEIGEVYATSHDDIENDVIDGLLREELIKAMDKAGISKKAQEIIKLIYGFDGPPMTLENIGKMYNVTRQRINQMEKSILKRLRKYWPSIVGLAEYTANPEKSIEKIRSERMKIKSKKYSG